jgi:hypothetical protein
VFLPQLVEKDNELSCQATTFVVIEAEIEVEMVAAEKSQQISKTRRDWKGSTMSS